MIRYDTDDAAFEIYPGSECFIAEAATNNFTSASVLFADANGRITEDNSNFRYSSDILYVGTSGELKINPAVSPVNHGIQIGAATTLGLAGVSIGGTASGVSSVAIKGTASGQESVAIGNGAIASAYFCVAVGTSSEATNRGISIGSTRTLVRISGKLTEKVRGQISPLL